MLVEDVNVIQVQIAVTIARHAPGGSLFDERTMPAQSLLGQFLDSAVDRFADRYTDTSSRFLENPQHGLGHSLEAAEARDSLVRFRGSVKGRDPLG